MVQLSTPPSRTPVTIAMIQQCPSFAYVTLLTRPSYLAGLLVLHQSLRAVHSMYDLVVMIPPTLPQETRDVLRRCRITVREVEWLHPPAGKYTPHQRDAHYIDTWTKLRHVVSTTTCVLLWALTASCLFYQSIRTDGV